MDGVNTLFSKFTEFWDKEFVVASLVPASAFVGFFVLASAWALGFAPTFLWLQQEGITEMVFITVAAIAVIVIVAYCLGALREIFTILWSEDSFQRFLRVIPAPIRSQTNVEILEKWIDSHGALDLFPVKLAGEEKRESIKQAWELVFPFESATAAKSSILGQLVGTLLSRASQRERLLRDRLAELRAIYDRILVEQEAILPEFDGRPSLLANRLRSMRDSAIVAYDQLGADQRKAMLQNLKKTTANAEADNREQNAEPQNPQPQANVQLPDVPISLGRDSFGQYVQILVNEAYQAATNHLVGRQNGVQASRLREFIKKNLLGLSPNLTRLGNIIASYKLYPAIAYGFDGEVYWPQLRFSLSKTTQGEKILDAIVDRRLALDFCITMATLSLAAIPVWFILVFGAFGVHGVAISVLAFFGLVLIGYTFYDAATGCAESLGDFIGAAYEAILETDGLRPDNAAGQGPLDPALARRHETMIARVWATTAGQASEDSSDVAPERGRSWQARMILMLIPIVALAGFWSNWPVGWVLVSRVALAECQVIGANLAKNGFRLELRSVSASAIEQATPKARAKCLVPSDPKSEPPIVRVATNDQTLEAELKPLEGEWSAGAFPLDRDVLSNLVLIRPTSIGSIITPAHLAEMPISLLDHGAKRSDEPTSEAEGDFVQQIFTPMMILPAASEDKAYALVASFWFDTCSDAPIGRAQLQKIAEEGIEASLTLRKLPEQIAEDERLCRETLETAASAPSDEDFPDDKYPFTILRKIVKDTPATLFIAGYADQRGDRTLNDHVATERAKVVAALLQQHKIPKDRMDSRSFGKDLPVFPLKDNYSFLFNRRVDIIAGVPKDQAGLLQKAIADGVAEESMALTEATATSSQH